MAFLGNSFADSATDRDPEVDAPLNAGFTLRNRSGPIHCAGRTYPAQPLAAPRLGEHGGAWRRRPLLPHALVHNRTKIVIALRAEQCSRFGTAANPLLAAQERSSPSNLTALLPPSRMKFETQKARALPKSVYTDILIVVPQGSCSKSATAATPITCGVRAVTLVPTRQLAALLLFRRPPPFQGIEPVAIVRKKNSGGRLGVLHRHPTPGHPLSTLLGEALGAWPSSKTLLPLRQQIVGLRSDGRP